jgi:hypothetical protein
VLFRSVQRSTHATGPLLEKQHEQARRNQTGPEAWADFLAFCHEALHDKVNCQDRLRVTAIAGGPKAFEAHTVVDWPCTFGDLEKVVDEACASTGWTTIDKTALRAAGRLVANMSAYLDTMKSDAKHYKRSVRLPKNSETGREAVVSEWQMGHVIHLSKHAKTAIRESLSTRSHASPSVRFIVRGHWRNQACGTAMTDHRLLWIEPYWKGPRDDAAVLTRLYEAELSKEAP